MLSLGLFFFLTRKLKLPHNCTCIFMQISNHKVQTKNIYAKSNKNRSDGQLVSYFLHYCISFDTKRIPVQ